MMREVKFELMWKHEDVFSTVVVDIDGLMSGLYATPRIRGGKKFELIAKRQFTGLFDKNENEIYEGDILKDDSGALSVVDFGGYFSKHSVGFGFHMLDNGDKSEFAFEFDPFGIERIREVIGNIHQNPELLE